MQEAVLKVQKLGAPPEGFEDDTFPGDEGFPSDETLDLWEDYQDAVDSITRPVTWGRGQNPHKMLPYRSHGRNRMDRSALYRERISLRRN